MPVTDEQRVELEKIAASSSLPHRRVAQARALLWAGEGVANEEIARRCGSDAHQGVCADEEIGRRCGVDSDAVRRWRSRFF